MTGVAVITGAGSGIGRATVCAFAEAGWRVALVGRKSETLAETVRIAGLQDDASCILAADVTKPDQVEQLFAEIERKFTRVDLLFNNAGRGSPARTIDETSLDHWFSVLETNVTGSFLCARSAFALMRRQTPNGGRIVNNGSISAHSPRPGSVPYTTSKHAISGLTRTLSLDGRPYNIVCGQIDIGNAGTEMTARMSGGVPQADGSVRPEKTFDVRHVADAVLRMAEMPLNTNVQFMTIMESSMPFVGRG